PRMLNAFAAVRTTSVCFAIAVALIVNVGLTGAVHFAQRLYDFTIRQHRFTAAAPGLAACYEPRRGRAPATLAVCRALAFTPREAPCIHAAAGLRLSSRSARRDSDVRSFRDHFSTRLNRIE